MNSTRLLLLFIVLTSLVLSNLATQIVEEENDDDRDEGNNIYELSEDQYDEEDEQFSGIGRMLLQKKRSQRLTCKKQSRVCLAKGSPGPNCCKKKCVNLLSNRMNCGKCGHKCKYNKICCNGKCVNPSFNKNHCGGCRRGCQKGELCVLGLCNYA